MQIYGRTDSRKLAFGWLSCHISIGRKPDMSKKTRSGSLRMGKAEVQIRYRGMVQTVPLFFSKRRRRREFLEQVI